MSADGPSLPSKEPDFEAQFDPEEESPRLAIIRVLATIEGTAPEELDPPLYEAIDPDAVNTLIEHNEKAAFVGFLFNDNQIIVENSGSIYAYC